MGTNGKFFLINAHGVLRRMCAVTEIPGSCIANSVLVIFVIVIVINIVVVVIKILKHSSKHCFRFIRLCQNTISIFYFCTLLINLYS